MPWDAWDLDMDVPIRRNGIQDGYPIHYSVDDVYDVAA